MTNSNGLMAGKKGLIMGVANDRSIAWGIAKQVADAGAELAFTFQGEALQKRVQPRVPLPDRELESPTPPNALKPHYAGQSVH